MKLNHNENARKLIKQMAIKNGITLNEISKRLDIKKGGVNQILHPDRNLRPETFVQIVQSINKNYKVSIDFYAPDHYRISVKNVQGVVEFGYLVDLRIKDKEA